MIRWEESARPTTEEERSTLTTLQAEYAGIRDLKLGVAMTFLRLGKPFVNPRLGRKEIERRRARGKVQRASRKANRR